MKASASGMTSVPPSKLEPQLRKHEDQLPPEPDRLFMETSLVEGGLSDGWEARGAWSGEAEAPESGVCLPT